MFYIFAYFNKKVEANVTGSVKWLHFGHFSYIGISLSKLRLIQLKKCRPEHKVYQQRGQNCQVQRLN